MCSVVLTQYRSMTKRRTDRRTDIYSCVKAQTALAARCKNRHLTGNFAYVGSNPNWIEMQFYTGVDILDVVTHANFGSHRFTRFRIVEMGRFLGFNIDVVLITLWQYRASV